LKFLSDQHTQTKLNGPQIIVIDVQNITRLYTHFTNFTTVLDYCNQLLYLSNYADDSHGSKAFIGVY